MQQEGRKGRVVPVDTPLLKANFAHVAMHGDQVALFFYSHLFLAHPETRDMFPVSMSAQRDRLLNALGRIVADVGDSGMLVPFLQDLGRDHRKFGVLADHYPAVGASLIATLKHFSGTEWTPELEQTWLEAYGVIAEVMQAAADADTAPASWHAQVIGYERRSVGAAVLRVSPEQPLPYRPGQSVALENPDRPRLWRYYSIANAPRLDGTLDFHVSIVDGGAVSTALVTRPPQWVRLGPAVGSCTWDDTSRRPVLMAAGGTGLAPLKSIIEQVSQRPDPPRITVFFGGRTRGDLYDVTDLQKMAAHWPHLSVTPVTEVESGADCATGRIVDVIAQYGTWRDHDAYVCGSSAMVEATVNRLRSFGVPAERVFFEDFGGSAW
jgi:NAD(P)H-flavin reductase/hemoglobin-like flavoprotein